MTMTYRLWLPHGKRTNKQKQVCFVETREGRGQKSAIIGKIS